MNLKNMILNINGVELEKSDRFLDKYARIKLAKEAIQRKWVVKLSRIPENNFKTIQKNGRGSQNNHVNKRKKKVKNEPKINLIIDFKDIPNY